MKEPILTVQNLSKRFGSLAAAENISLAVKPGEIVGFIGPNGAGKTTTMSMIMGFLRPDQGDISILNQKVTPEIAHISHRHIGYIAGDMALLDNLTGEQYIDHMARLNKADSQLQSQLIAELKPTLNKPIKNLSRGNKQKVALIGALQHNPKLLILDEPTSGLDPLMQEVFLKLVSQAANDGAAAFMSSHILSEVSQVCDRMLFMKQGKIISDSTRTELEQQAGKEIIISATASSTSQLLKTMPTEVDVIEKSPSKLVLRTKQPVGPILKWLTLVQIDDLTIRDRDLDSIFHDMYKEAN